MKRENKRVRTPKFPGETMAHLSIRLPLALKEKLKRISNNNPTDWVIKKITNTDDCE